MPTSFRTACQGPGRALPSTTESLGHRCSIEVPPAADVARLATGIARCSSPDQAIGPIGTGTRRDRQRHGRDQASSTQIGQDRGAALRSTLRGAASSEWANRRFTDYLVLFCYGEKAAP